MKKIKGIIFDMDGVIFDTERISCRFWQKKLKEHGMDMTEDMYTEIMGRNRVGIIKGLESMFNRPEIDFYKLSDEKVAQMGEFLDTGRIPVLPGVFEIIDYLDKNGYKKSIATSTRRVKAESRLKKENLFDHFDSIMYGDDVKISKPNPEIFLKTAEKMELNPSEILILEDSPSGIEAAYNGGFRCINVVDMKKPTDEMKSRTIAICDNLFDVIEWLEKNNI